MSTASVAIATAPPLRVESLVKRFGAVTAVSGVSFEVGRGECLGLLGPNGAGKSTLIRGIAGRVLVDSGGISIFGAPAESARARAALGWVPQELALYPRLTGRENLASFGRYHGLSGSALERSIDWCLDWAALRDRAGEPVQHLSGGMKRRLNMAAGLIHQPKLVLLDEPTVGVDPQSRNRIFEMIENLHAAGRSIIYTTHYMEEAERLCDRIAIIDRGNIIAMGSNAELVENAFASRSELTIRFDGGADRAAEWIEQRGGRVADSGARFSIERPGEIAGLLEAAAQAGLEVADVSLRKPNLEAVFLHLTGRELRD